MWASYSCTFLNFDLDACEHKHLQFGWVIKIYIYKFMVSTFMIINPLRRILGSEGLYYFYSPSFPALSSSAWGRNSRIPVSRSTHAAASLRGGGELREWRQRVWTQDKEEHPRLGCWAKYLMQPAKKKLLYWEIYCSSPAHLCTCLYLTQAGGRNLPRC